ncbi:hypothetical protein ALQ34_102041 [Pseudomonas syringae pv. maculicola]|uniref:hypothetical protein n=1 Tax=Pseudomonas syringae group genomosp. 3 TaxID=251701 RepID=UPI000F3E996C|nr:hypothetical protein [Pseudomonas syringae group genomosp. 3]RMO81161.1 hypothetical protein ALQ34_102041 [Pseudomonas syringae pv. maculicola]
MKTRKSQLLSRRHRYLGLPHTRSRCKQCVACSTAPDYPTKLQIVSAMYAYLMTSWEELPDQNKRALGFDSVVGGEEEEAALNRLAGLFMEYADVSLRRALDARRRRLGGGSD